MIWKYVNIPILLALILIHLGCATDSEFQYMYQEDMVQLDDLFTPAHNSVVDTLTPSFTWQAITGATGYILEINDKDIVSTTETNYTLQEELTCIHYPFKWRVKAINQTQVLPSEYKLFFVDSSFYEIPPGYPVTCGKKPVDVSVPQALVENVEIYSKDENGREHQITDGALTSASNLFIRATFKEPGDCLPPSIPGYDYTSIRYFGAVTLNVNDIEFELRPIWDAEQHIWTFNDFEFSLTKGDKAINTVAIVLYGYEAGDFIPLGRSQIYSITGDFSTPDFQLQLYWNNLGDMDLHLFAPDRNRHCFWPIIKDEETGEVIQNHRWVELEQGGTMQLDIDKTADQGYGPENIKVFFPDPGTYLVQIQYYGAFNAMETVPIYTSLFVFKEGVLQDGTDDTENLIHCENYTHPCINPNPLPGENDLDACYSTHITIAE